ncbi:MAG: diaminopropionate ammonia-lyase [Candidatus Zixiibacteriota bacterium]
MCRSIINPLKTPAPFWTQPEYSAFENDDIEAFHRSISGYEPTPLVSLSSLARHLGVRRLLVKDESRRFELKAFKAMGASYAIYRYIKQVWEKQFGVQFELTNLCKPDLLEPLHLMPFCTATDGNHGRAVAWFARLLGQKAYIYVPAGTVRARMDNIRNEGAVVVEVDGDYDAAVERVAEDAERNGWTIISDTSYPGYTLIPAFIMAGYTTMFREIDNQLSDLRVDPPTHIIIQSGVGSFAAAAAWYYHRYHSEKPPALISVEPTEADCLLESVCSGDVTSSKGSQQTIMAGLNCATPSLIAWPLIRDRFSLFISIPDNYAKRAMRSFFYPDNEDPRIISGESGAAGLAGLIALQSSQPLAQAKRAVDLGPNSTVLLFNTEGDTDPEHFREVTSKS